MKHSIVLHTIDREDGWLISPVVIELDKEYKTYSEAYSTIKHLLEAEELVNYLVEKYDIRTLAFEMYGFNLEDESVVLKFDKVEITYQLTYKFNLVDSETGEELDAEYQFSLGGEFAVSFSGSEA